jgi:hypothetical protein
MHADWRAAYSNLHACRKQPSPEPPPKSDVDAYLAAISAMRLPSNILKDFSLDFTGACVGVLLAMPGACVAVGISSAQTALCALTS